MRAREVCSLGVGSQIPRSEAIFYGLGNMESQSRKHQTLNPRDPSIQIIPTLGPKVCKYYLHWAIWIPRVNPKH